MREGGNVTVISGKYKDPITTPNVLRVWDHGTAKIPLQVLRAAESSQVDAILLNTSFTSWGSNVGNLAGLMIPWLLHKQVRVITLVHDLPHLVDHKRVGYRLTPVHKLAIQMATKSIASSHVVVFTLERNASFFRSLYPQTKVVTIHHGLLGETVFKPLTRNNTVMTFGKFGRAKNPEPLIKLFHQNLVCGNLVVGGTSAATKPGYVESLQQQYVTSNIAFTGYVEEEDVPGFFHNADLIVLPYEENVGASGVLMQVAQYGRPVILRRLPVFEQMVEDLGLSVHFYNTDEELLKLLRYLLPQKEQLEREGKSNFDAVQHLSMCTVAKRYWNLLEG